MVNECSSLQEVRDNIDRIDRMIVHLISERGGYVKQAAKFKSNTTEVKASDRVQKVIDNVLSIASECTANLVVVEAAYRSMIAAFISTELSEFKSLNEKSSPV